MNLSSPQFVKLFSNKSYFKQIKTNDRFIHQIVFYPFKSFELPIIFIYLLLELTL